jgi:hypothetical protein
VEPRDRFLPLQVSTNVAVNMTTQKKQVGNLQCSCVLVILSVYECFGEILSYCGQMALQPSVGLCLLRLESGHVRWVPRHHSMARPQLEGRSPSMDGSMESIE